MSFHSGASALDQTVKKFGNVSQRSPGKTLFVSHYTRKGFIMYYFENFLQSAPHLVIPLRDLYFPPDHWIYLIREDALVIELQAFIRVWHANRLITSEERKFLLECLPTL